MSLYYVLTVVFAFYMGVFMCDYANLKFRMIISPFVYIFNYIKSIINKKTKDCKNDYEEERKENIY